MAGFLDLFKSNSETTSAADSASSTTNPSPNNANTNISAEKTPDGKMPGTDQGATNPLDAYSKMFEKATESPEVPPAFAIDKSTLDGVAGAMQFTKNADPELLQRATSGDTGALLELINVAAQQSYKAALQHSTTLTDKYVGLRSEYERKNLPSHIKNQLTSNELSTTPNYNHPVVKNQLNLIAADLASKNPDASPAEIAKMAQQYMIDVANAINPDTSKSQDSSSEGEKVVDWTKYLTS